MSRYPGSYIDNPTRNPDAGGGKLDSVPAREVEAQTTLIANGVLSIPADQAIVSIARWSSALRGWNDAQLGHLARSLDDLAGALGEPTLSGNRIGVLLARLGMETRTIAGRSAGPAWTGVGQTGRWSDFCGNLAGSRFSITQEIPMKLASSSLIRRSLIRGWPVGALVVTALMAGCSTAPETVQGRVALNDDARATLVKLEEKDPSLRSVIDGSVGYVVFPSVGKGAVIVGGGYGHGVVYERGIRVGYADVTQANIGASLGGQSYSQVIVFNDVGRFNQFKNGNFTWTANASAVAIKSGAAAGTQFQDGVAIFADADAGLMGDASLGGQRYTYSGD